MAGTGIIYFPQHHGPGHAATGLRFRPFQLSENGEHQLPEAESTPKSAGDSNGVGGGGTASSQSADDLTDRRVQYLGAKQLPEADSTPKNSDGDSNGAAEGTSPANGLTDRGAHDSGLKRNLEQQDSEEVRSSPMKRHASGGKPADKSVNLQANCFPIKYNLGKTLLQYDVHIEHVEPAKVKRSLTKSEWKKLLKNSPSSRFTRDVAVFDGHRLLSLEKLPTEHLELDCSGVSYNVTVQLGNLNGENNSPDMLQALDVVMKESLSRNGIYGGCTGFHQSLKFTSGGPALFLDTSELPFCNRMPVIDFLKENVVNFHEANDVNWRDVEIALKGLKVTVNHRTKNEETKNEETKNEEIKNEEIKNEEVKNEEVKNEEIKNEKIKNQKFKINGLTEDRTGNLSFKWKGCETKVVDYFLQKYNKNIDQKIPCLKLGKRRTVVPMECCDIASGQWYNRKVDDGSAKLLRDRSVVSPAVRNNMICEIARSGYGTCGEQVFQNLGIEVDPNMTRVVARVLEPPTVKLGNGTTAELDQDKCLRNVLVQKSLVEGVRIQSWALIDFSGSMQNRRIFVDQLMKHCRSLGVHMMEPLTTLSTNMDQLRSFENTRTKLEEVIKQARQEKQGQLQVIVCAVACKGQGYDRLKFVSETEIGVLTQCFQTKKANKSKNDQFLASLALKMNAKVGGRNFELDEQLPGLKKEDPVMLIGAAVNHPASFKGTSRSIAAVVASVNWPGVSRYAARFCFQKPREEKIVEFGSMCFDLLNTYVRLNGVKPKKIVVFRDGASDDQFDMVLNEEFSSLESAICDENYKPEITLIVAQKRDHTHLFLENDGEDGCPLNVPPWTVVDSPITHPDQFEFYLCSHFGTSKLTHYEARYGKDHFSKHDLQNLIHHLCFTFARCTGHVSLVPPVYYSHLVLHRARMYERVSMKLQSRGSPSSSSSGTLSEKNLIEVHSNLKDCMFFV